MKNVILVMAAMMILISCSQKQAEQQSAPTEEKPKVEKISATEAAKKYGIEISSLDYTEGTNTRSNKQKASSVTLSVLTDLVLTAGLNCTTSPDAEWGGIQRWVDSSGTLINGVSFCNFNWTGRPTDPNMSCPTTASGTYRGWTSDKVTYNVHLSNLITQ